MEIKYLKHSEINKQDWDKCISRSFNGIVYGYSWYLDIVSFDWEALVLGNYEAVMPLTVKNKYWINYIYQPPYTQQLGIFTFSLLTPELVEQFIRAIPEKYKVIDIQLNTYNKVSLADRHVTEKLTYELDLILSYSDLVKKFKSNTKRNIRKAEKNGVKVIKNINLKEFLLLLKTNSKEPVTFDQLNILRQIIPFTISHNMGAIYSGYNNHNELVAAAYFIWSHQKAIYLLSASTDEGKEDSAMFAIVNSFIREKAERNITLDFEGSMIENLARFYSGFGAEPCTYARVKINKLPWPLRLFT